MINDTGGGECCDEYPVVGPADGLAAGRHSHAWSIEHRSENGGH